MEYQTPPTPTPPPAPQPEAKRLYRSRTNSIIFGICGGIGEYFKMDPVLIRLIAVVVVLCTGIFPGVIAYIIAYFVIPERPL